MCVGDIGVLVSALASTPKVPRNRDAVADDKRLVAGRHTGVAVALTIVKPERRADGSLRDGRLAARFLGRPRTWRATTGVNVGGPR